MFINKIAVMAPSPRIPKSQIQSRKSQANHLPMTL